jgi:hypothetical protein
LTPQDYKFVDLIYPAVVIFLVVMVVTFLATRSVIGAAVGAGIKAGLFLLNFAVFFTGQVTGFDDLYYLDVASDLSQGGFAISDLFLRGDALASIAQSAHIIYPIHNYYAMLLFGDHYFAPVALNVLFTVAIAFVGTRLTVAEFQLTRRQARMFFLFLLLYPEILAWSTVFNGKETLVLLCHVLLLTGVSKLLRGRILAAIAFIAPAAYFLAGLRYYVLPLFAVAFLVYSLLASKSKHKGKTILFAAVCVSAVLVQQFSGLSYGINLIISTFSDPLYGLIHFALTPIPFLADATYAFLNLPAFYHWLAFPFLLVGVRAVHRMKTPFSRFFIIYFCTIIAFYSVFEGLQGPRHRFQLAFAFAIFEFTGVLVFLRAVVPVAARPLRRNAAVAEVSQGQLNLGPD